MLRLLLYFAFVAVCLSCPRQPTVYQSRVAKIPGDHGYHIDLNGSPEKYVPGKLYTLFLMGSRTFSKVQRFTRFIINVESTTNSDNNSPQNVGNFQLFDDNLSRFNEECINTVWERDSLPKTEVFLMWSAPPPGSGCVTFRGMVFEDPTHWYADDGRLSRTICEQKDTDAVIDDKECCACDEAKYSLIFEGIWSNKTHPKDFPFSLWLTHFSDVIGASHERNFTFWGEGQIASEGFRSLAEWGSVRLMETELRAKSKFLRTIIKAAGLWYPHVNTNTSTNFRVDRRHHLVSLASMFGPTPDWVVGVNGLNLCLKNCSWLDELVVDLYPYDAGTDSGVTYMSPNAETQPRERMYRITTMYPEDPRAPFYDPSGKEMLPLAKMYLKREKVIPKNCDESFLNAQLDVSENTEDVSRMECSVSEYTDWSPCSVTCGKGLRMRTREYRLPQKAQMFKCNRQLVSKEMCVAAVPECDGATSNNDESEEKIDALESTPTGICKTSDWSPWSECSVSCGVGFTMRTRFFKEKMGRKKCPHITIVEKDKCMRPECNGNGANAESKNPVNQMCPTTDWSDWSPCSATCGKGVRLRTRLLLVVPELQQKCSAQLELIQQTPCIDTPDCTFDMATAKSVCMQESELGPCQGYFNRWHFNSQKGMCLPFIYGGCRGNRNNFLTFEECKNACGVIGDLVLGNVPTTNPAGSAIPVNCIVSEWSQWSPCSATCGTGTTERFRMIKRQPENFGKACPAKLNQRRRCVERQCS